MWRFLAYCCVYGVGAFGALQLGRLELGHSICGPWGCGPPTEALLAMHCFWLVSLLVAAFALKQSFPISELETGGLVRDILECECLVDGWYRRFSYLATKTFPA